MMQEIIPVEIKLPYKMGSVNCYLIKTDTGFILIDTGSTNKRFELQRKFEQIECSPGNLRLIILTHGDFDHTGNAAFIRKIYNTKIAMHAGDSQMVEQGDMFLNRQKGNFFQSWIVKTLFGFGKSERFKPDLEITDGFDLTGYGLKAKVIHIPGHSKGSIGIITIDGTLICGDLIENTSKIDGPKINTIMDDLTMAKRSINTLGNLNIDMVYPGHGQPFKMNAFLTKLHNAGIK